MFQGSGFGNPSNSTPFGSFAKPATGFATPVFGSTNTSLFGQTPQPSTGGLFGSTTPAPAFGQTQTAQPSFGGFTSTAGGSGLFGTQQNATTSGTGLFGSTGTSAFGQAKPAFGSFTSPSTGGGLFGQQLTTQAQTPSIFGQTATAGTSNLFGSTAANGDSLTLSNKKTTIKIELPNPPLSPISSSTPTKSIKGFGNAIGATPNSGTTIKFTAVTGTDTMIKNGISQPISTRHHCITCMKEYETKSLEELRLEDYAANRKGPQQGVQNSGGLFSQPSLFGSGPSTSATAGGLFGQTENKPLFGSTNTSLGFGGTSNVFGSSGGGLFGKPAVTQPSAFGTTPTTTNSFAFNTSTNTNPFGTNTSQVKPFGAVTPQTNLFNTTQPTPAFGATQTPGFGSFGTQPAQNTGLFQQNKSPFSVGATANTGFSFGQTAPASTQATTSLFGAKPATTGFGTTFGAAAPTSASSFGGGFGTQNTSSVFGNTFKPPTTGFSFGQTPTTSSTLGSGLNLGGGSSLFANNANKPGGLFGNTTGGGLFGSSTFGSTGNTGFGATNNTGLGSSFALGNSSLIGSQVFSTSGYQQVLQNTFNQQISESLAARPFGNNNIFQKMLPVTGKAEELLKPTSVAAQKALLAEKNFKVSLNSPKFNLKTSVVNGSHLNHLNKKTLFNGLDADEDEFESALRMIQPSPKRLEIKPIGKENLSRDILNKTTLPGLVEKPVQRKEFVIPSASRLFDSISTNEASQNEQDATSSFDLKNSSKDETYEIPTTSKSPTGNDRTVTMDTFATSRGGAENTITELCQPKPTSVKLTSPENKETLDHSSPSTSSESDTSELLINAPPHPAGIVLNRVGYYTIPPMDKLAQLVDSDGRCIVDNFTVGRYNYGNVFYPESFDVAGLNLDEIVHIRYKEINVYPDDEGKPPVGQGLNRPAQVTLDRVWPTDRVSRLPISDPERLLSMDYEDTLRRASVKNKSRFKEYRPQTGSWVFKVDHFSKYGLSDSDDDEDILTLTEVKKQRMNDVLQPGNFPPGSKELALQQGLNGSWAPPLQKNGELLMEDDDQDMEDGLIKTPFDLDENYQPMHQSPTSHFAKQLGASSNKVQLMKASFFNDDSDDFNIDGDYIDFRDGSILDFNELQKESKLHKSFPVLRTQFTSKATGTTPPAVLAVKVPATSEVSKLVIPLTNLGPVAPPLPLLHPQTVVLRCPDGVIPYSMSTVAKINARCLADNALMLGRSFRARWGKDYTLLSLSTKQVAAETTLSAPLLDVGTKLEGRVVSDMTPSIVQRIQLLGGQMDENILDFQVCYYFLCMWCIQLMYIELSV